MTLLDVRGLTIHYDLPQGTVRAVEDATFTVDRGEVVAIIGESGSGKTTLAMAIAGLLRPPGRVVRGHIYFDGLDLSRLDDDKWREIRGRDITVVFQDPNTYLNPLMSVGRQVAEVFEAHGMGSIRSREVAERAIEILRRVRIQDPDKRYWSYPHELSGGMKQRVLIAMAIALKPKLLIADEPTSALDATIQAQILDLLEELRREMGMSLLLITHDLGVAARIAHRIIVMYAGQMVEVGRADEIMSDPLHPYTRALVRSVKLDRKRLLGVPSGAPPSLISPPPGCRFHPRCPYATEQCTTWRHTLYVRDNRRVACVLYA